MLALAAPLAITVNQAPLRSDAPPLLERRHVLVPARAVFASLGASVTYDARQRRMEVRRGATLLVLSIGSPYALDEGHAVRIDAPVRVYHARTYVPLRFLAQAFGATVDFDEREGAVRIFDPTLEPVTAEPPAARLAYAPPSVEFRRPAPGEVVDGAFPSISATLETHGGPAVDPSSVRIFLDGRDVTDRISRLGEALGYTPAQQLPAGPHEVTVQGADDNGVRFTSNWQFNSDYSYEPGPPSAGSVPVTFYLNGGYTYGSPMQLVLLGPSGGWGYIDACGYGQRFPLVYGPTLNTYYALVSLPANLYAPSCYISGYFYDSEGNRSFVSLAHPLTVNTVNANNARATATPTLVPVRRSMLSPSVRPRATPEPTPVPTPRAHPAALKPKKGQL